MIRHILTLTAGTAIGATLTLAGVVNATDLAPTPVALSSTAKPAPVVPWFTKRPCQQEDYVNCSWNASEQGNGVGHSFIVRKMPHSGVTCWIYEKKADRKLDFCTRPKRR